jgi:hypothetical protein
MQRFRISNVLPNSSTPSQAWPNNKSCSKISSLPGSTTSKPFSPECTVLNLINSMKSRRLVWGKRPLRMYTSTVSNGDMHSPLPLFSTPTPVLSSRVFPPDALRPPQPISSVIHHASEFEMLQSRCRNSTVAFQRCLHINTTTVYRVGVVQQMESR